MEAAARDCRDFGILEIFLNKPGILITPLAFKQAMGRNQSHTALRLLLERGGCLAAGSDELIVNEKTAELRQVLRENAHLAIEHDDLPSLKLVLSFQYPEIRGNDVSDFKTKVPEDLYRYFTYGAYNAVQRNDPNTFEWIYSLGIRQHDTMSLDDFPEEQHLNLQHLLDKAAQASSVDCVRLLIEKYGADPSKYRLPRGITPLCFAAANNQPSMVRYLLDEHKVDAHIGNGRYAAVPTALWMAIRLKAYECIPILLQHGGPVDHIDDEILNIDGPIDAVLLALTSSDNVKVELLPELNLDINSYRHDYQRPNSPYVRVNLTPEDKPWIEKLQYRKLADLWRDWREFSGNEGARAEDMDENDMRRQMPPYPTFEGKEKSLEEDDDLITAYLPAFIPANQVR